jgi:hypothetical protein
MPKLINIAVESPGRYVVNSESHVWRGQGGQTPGAPMAITWELVTSEFRGGSGPARFVGGPQPGEEEDELEL